MFEQLSFFDAPIPKPQPKVSGNIISGRKLTDPLYGYTDEQIKNAEQLKDWCFLYTSGRKNCTIRFMMNREDAMRFCSSPKSKGCTHGNRWMYIFMCVWNWLGEMPVGCRKIYIYKDDDNGNYDYLIEELQCKAVRIEQIPEILVPLGVNVSVGEHRKPPKNKNKPSRSVTADMMRLRSL